jgi:hypothetical protein
MGWFLKSNPKKSAAKQRRTRALGPSPWDPRKTLAAMQLMGAMGLLLAVGVSWRHLEQLLSAYAAENQTVPATANERVALLSTPVWMNKTLQQQLTDAAARELSTDPADTRSLPKLLDTLAKNPWVEQVTRVQRSPSGQVLVTAQYRQPVALVESPEGYCVVDAKGTRLPGVYPRHNIQRLSMPVITGVSAKTATEGSRWPGQDVQAALSLIRVLSDQPYMTQIQSFDVSERDPRGRIRLVLRTKLGMIRWGLPPGDEQTIEPDASVKKQWLTNVYKTYRGSVDAGGKVVDVYGAAVFVHPNRDAEIDQQAGFTWSR